MAKEYPHNAPKDGRLLLLRVKVAEGCEHPLEDEEIFTTVGLNNLANTGDDEWQIVGWNWCGDCFTQLDGDFEILGWAEIPEILVRGGDRSEVEPCPTCGGTGVDGTEGGDPDMGEFYTDLTCLGCGGSGYISSDEPGILAAGALADAGLLNERGDRNAQTGLINLSEQIGKTRDDFNAKHGRGGDRNE